MGEALEALGINGPFLLSQIVNFLILLILLRVFLWKPLMERLDERREMLAQQQEDAAAVAEARANIDAERERKLEEARAEAEKILVEARERANNLQEQTIQEAGKEADKIVAEARQEAEEERNRILGEMRGQIAALATSAAQRIIGEKLDEERQRALVDSFFSGVREGRVVVLPEEMEELDEPVTVTSAIPLTDDEKETIQQEVGDVGLSFEVDPQILGGLVIRAGDRVVDSSVVGQLERLKETLA